MPPPTAATRLPTASHAMCPPKRALQYRHEDRIDTKTVLFERLELCCFIPDHLPILFAAARPSDSKGHRTAVLVRHRPPVPKTPRARLPRDITHRQGSPGRGMHPKMRLAPDAPGPSQVSQMARSEERRVGKECRT